MGFLTQEEQTSLQATNKFMYDIGVSRVQATIKSQMPKTLHFTAFSKNSNEVISYFAGENFRRTKILENQSLYKWISVRVGDDLY